MAVVVAVAVVVDVVVDVVGSVVGVFLYASVAEQVVRQNNYPGGQFLPRLSPSVSGAFRLFSFHLANGTLEASVLAGVEYFQIFHEPTVLEQTYAIYANMLEIDEHGEFCGDERARHRAAQYIRHFLDPSYKVEPPFEAWEMELHT